MIKQKTDNLYDPFKMFVGKHLMIQPHLDDLAFSLGHILLNQKLSVQDITVWTIFGKETFNIRGYSNNKETYELLRNEENIWFEKLRITKYRLELEEAGYRGVDKIRTLFQPQNTSEFSFANFILPNGNLLELNNSIDEILNDNFDYLWVPAGVGGHCDHLAVRHSVLNNLVNKNLYKTIVFYEELPYSLYSKPIRWEDTGVPKYKFVKNITYHPTEDEVLIKTESISVFHSQINLRHAKVLSSHSESIAIWINNKY